MKNGALKTNKTLVSFLVFLAVSVIYLLARFLLGTKDSTVQSSRPCQTPKGIITFCLLKFPLQFHLGAVLCNACITVRWGAVFYSSVDIIVASVSTAWLYFGPSIEIRLESQTGFSYSKMH